MYRSLGCLFVFFLDKQENVGCTRTKKKKKKKVSMHTCWQMCAYLRRVWMPFARLHCYLFVYLYISIAFMHNACLFIYLQFLICKETSISTTDQRNLFQLGYNWSDEGKKILESYNNKEIPLVRLLITCFTNYQFPAPFGFHHPRMSLPLTTRPRKDSYESISPSISFVQMND